MFEKLPKERREKEGLVVFGDGKPTRVKRRKMIVEKTVSGEEEDDK